MKMRPGRWLGILVVNWLLLACVDQLEVGLSGKIDVLVVEGTITDLVEPQQIKISRSQTAPFTGRVDVVPVTKATVELIVDSGKMVPCHETQDGVYQAPADFRGQVGHAYQLRFTLADGTRYESTPEVMPAAPPIQRTEARFNPNSLSPVLYDGYTAGHDFYVDVQDPAETRNYYRWDWRLWERQFWCRSCEQGVYAINKILPRQYRAENNLFYFVSGNEPFNDCFTPPPGYAEFTAPYVREGKWHYDYECQGPCWEVFYNSSIDVFDDGLTNGGLIQRRNVAQVPFFTHEPALVDIRQSALTKGAYTYYKSIQEQTKNTGGLTDTPPDPLVGNVINVTNPNENVVGYFTASGVAQVHYWLDRKDTQGLSLGGASFPDVQLDAGEELYITLNNRRLRREPSPPYISVSGVRDIPDILIWGGPPRPPLVPCRLSDSRTPFKPQGWRE